jgi:ABC-2 type transport system ATP-binding protein
MSKLKIENISKSYRNHVALNDVSFDVKDQRIFGLLGPNGAGKTSLIRIINQITSPDSGRVLIDGKQLNGDHIHQIGYLPEERGLYKKMKVGEQAIYLAQLKGLSRSEAIKRLRYWFQKFELAGWWDKKVEELSKGMAQKVQFITTVLHEPELLILDEPFSGFDPINTNLIKKEILELRAKGTTIILSTHNMNSVEEICDDIVLIDDAKILLEGEVKSLKNKFKPNQYEITFEGNTMGFTNAMWTDYDVVETFQEGNAIRANIALLNGKKLNDLLKIALDFVEIHEVQEIMPNMNDIFISVVEQNDQKVELSTEQ